MSAPRFAFRHASANQGPSTVTLADLPGDCFPSLPVAVLTFLFMPVLCMALFFFVVAAFALIRPRPYSTIAFFGSALLAGVVASGERYWEYSLQCWIAMSVAGLAVVGEVLIRGLAGHYTTVGGVVGICLGHYFFLLSVVALAPA